MAEMSSFGRSTATLWPASRTTWKRALVIQADSSRCTSAGTARSAAPASTSTGASTCASAPRTSGRVPIASAANATPSA